MATFKSLQATVPASPLRSGARRSRVAVPALLLVGYLGAVRPRLLVWGATDDEVLGRFPGAEIVAGGTRSATMAVTIDAPPSQVWPWLVQMGLDRAGWYSWDRLDNFGHRSANRIHPEWQSISIGDHLTAKPDGGQWWTVAALQPERFLGLRMSLDLRGCPFDPAGARPRYYTDSTWGFKLDPLAGDRTRLVVSGYWALRRPSDGMNRRAHQFGGRSTAAACRGRMRRRRSPRR